MIPWPIQYAPDRPGFAPDAADAYLNVLPVEDGWGPMPAFTPLSEPLHAPCKGAVFVRKTNGVTDIYAGTATRLLRYDGGSNDWENVSRLSGGDYNVASGNYWSFELFGATLIAVHPDDDPQFIDIDTGDNFVALGGLPDRARVAVAMGFQLCLAGHTEDPARMSLSGYGDPSFWVRFRNGSGRQVLEKGGHIQNAIGDQSGGFLFQHERIQRMTLQPNDTISFRIDDWEAERGLLAPYAVARAGNRIFFKSEDDFYALGQPSQPLGSGRVSNFILDNQAPDFATFMQGAADPINGRIFWRWWRASTTEDHSDEIIIFDWIRDRWARVAMNLQYIFPAATQGYTLEQLGAAGLGYTLETLPYPFGSRVWRGGTPVFAAFDENNQLGFFDGSALAATLETGDIGLGGMDRRAFVQGFRPVDDANAGTGAVARKDTAASTRVWSDPASPNAHGLIPFRSSGRLHRFRRTIPAGTSWTAALGLEPIFRPAGKQ